MNLLQVENPQIERFVYWIVYWTQRKQIALQTILNASGNPADSNILQSAAG